MEGKKKRNNGFTELEEAIINENTEIIKTLLARPDIDVNKSSQSGSTPLFRAIFHCSAQHVRLLLAHPNIDVNKGALCYAASRGYVEIVSMLLAHDDLVVGVAAAKLALRNNQFHVLELLLPYINPNMRDEDSLTILMCALQYDDSLSLVEMLVSHPKIKINMQTISLGKASALQFAALYKTHKAVKLLIRHGAHPECILSQPFLLTYITSESRDVLYAWKTYLPKWNRFTTCKFFPLEFNGGVARVWLLCCKRLDVFPKDVRYLILEYIAEAWKTQ